MSNITHIVRPRLTICCQTKYMNHDRPSHSQPRKIKRCKAILTVDASGHKEDPSILSRQKFPIDVYHMSAMFESLDTLREASENMLQHMPHHTMVLGLRARRGGEPLHTWIVVGHCLEDPRNPCICILQIPTHNIVIASCFSLHALSYNGLYLVNPMIDRMRIAMDTSGSA